MVGAFLFLLFSSVFSSHAVPIDVMKYTFKLESFSIDGVSCTEEDLEEGVRGFVQPLSKDKSVDPRSLQRYLLPGFHPRLGLASWHILTPEDESKPGCSQMGPLYNGIGFSSFDMRDGRATLYLARFVPSRRSDQIWRAQRDPAIRLGLLFNPELEVTRLRSFPAQCTLQKNSRALVFVLAGYLPAAEMVCVLDGEGGEVRLSAADASGVEIPSVLQELLREQKDLLYGAPLQP